MLKVCSLCLSPKRRSNFYKTTRMSDGLDYYCKPCRNGYSMRNITENPKTCSVKDCTKPHYALNMCRSHYCRHNYKVRTSKQKAGRKR